MQAKERAALTAAALVTVVARIDKTHVSQGYQYPL
jgi:hypothetical protein